MRGPFLFSQKKKRYDFWSRKRQCSKCAESCLSEEARGAPAASEQPKRRFSTEKTRVHHTWLEIKDRALFAWFFSQNYTGLVISVETIRENDSCADSTAEKEKLTLTRQGSVWKRSHLRN
ncbi:hypothetical protein C0674_00635 [Sporolactobacillus terrae]|uniref:Uncharacterized protein n=1 Tax=Sporolactobacillus terrae TaxID=269673 RepID=A0ABX5Q3P7_9BACL|nr:hypothetical protein C0674_00635 [Sporolactobacillus terrae]QAA24235.1 hypothetical protein C0679_00615 [Sporolactobacillus terrae]